jgi:hypothetical protein
MCSAVADLTGDPANPPYAGVNDDEVLYPGSLQKISAMYAAFLLRAQVQAQVSAAVHGGLSTHTRGWEKPVIADLERGWQPPLRTEFPKLPPAGFPQLATIFEFTSTGDVEFRQSLSEACIECLGEFGTPTGGFGDWLRLMIRWSNNSAASRCIRALGYRYLNGALEQGGFFTGSPAQGLWLSGDYLGHDWIPNPPGNPQANRAGQPLTARWATAQGRTLSNMTATASQVCRFMTLIAQRKLIDGRSSDGMLELLDKSKPGTNSWVSIALANAHRKTDRLFSKIGIGDDDRYHDCAIVERTLASGTKVRYVVVGLGSKKGDITDLYRLFVALDDAIAARHPHP